MSICDIETTMERIKSAPPESPIAVFRCGFPGQVNALFATTIKTSDRIEDGDNLFVGVFDRTMDMHHVREQLRHVCWSSVIA